jgi:hypothetical protein
MFDATNSTYLIWWDDGQGGYDLEIFNVNEWGLSLAYWSINGVDIAFGLTPTISYDTLVNGLGLGLGTYDVTLNLSEPMIGYDMATTTIEIIPEPASIFLLALASIALLRKRKG